MRNFLAIIALLLPLSGICQDNEIPKIGLYKWTEAVFIQPCDIDGANTLDPAIPSKAGQKFRVITIKDGANAIIQILDYTTSSGKADKKLSPTTDFYRYNFDGIASDYSNLSDEDANSRSYGDKQRYFKVGVAYIEALAVRETRIGGALAAGVINFPFKYRPQKGNADFSGAFNFGAGIGYKFHHKSWRQFTYSIISGYSISNVVLDSSNANKNQGKLSSTNNFTAFSFSLGLLAEYQRVQAGIFIGWDRISKLNHREFDWQYQGKPWISVGFGFAIFSGQKEQGDKNTTADQND